VEDEDGQAAASMWASGCSATALFGGGDPTSEF
jgi:hypothetical protein